MKLIPNWKKAGEFYSVQAALVGGGIISGMFVLNMFGVQVPQVYSYVASFLTISAVVVLRVVNQDKTAMPDLPEIPKGDE